MGARPEPQQSVESPLPSLSDRDRAILDFERDWWKHAGAKEEAIRETFGLSAARYYQVLNAVIDVPAAVRHDPMLVGRLHRAREARTAARAARSFTNPRTGGGDIAAHPSETTE